MHSLFEKFLYKQICVHLVRRVRAGTEVAPNSSQIIAAINKIHAGVKFAFKGSELLNFPSLNFRLSKVPRSTTETRRDWCVC